MPTGKRTSGPEFIIDSSRDRRYPLLISDHPEIAQFIREIPLKNISWDCLVTLANPDATDTVLDALLIPTDTARTISVVVGTTVVGTLPDAGVVADSQIARVYASGLLPTCKLVIAPGDSVVAKVCLYASDGGVPYNNPPANNWALLPAGSRWQVEPTRLSPFKGIPDQSRVLVELRASEDIISIFLDGTECGILDMDAADALNGAVALAIKDGYVPVARGCTEYHHDGQISLHIDALPAEQWCREDAYLDKNPLAKLVPYQSDPSGYAQGMLAFIRAHEITRSPSQENRTTIVEGLRKIGPYLLLVLAACCAILSVAIDALSARGTVGLLGCASILGFLSGWVLFCRSRDTEERKRTRYWEFLIPLSVSALIPSVAFANIGVFYDTRTHLAPTTPADMTTLQSFPGNGDPLPTFLDEEPETTSTDIPFSGASEVQTSSSPGPIPPGYPSPGVQPGTPQINLVPDNENEPRGLNPTIGMAPAPDKAIDPFLVSVGTGGGSFSWK